CFSYIDNQQQRIDLLEAHLGSMQQELRSLYLSSSWRYSWIIRSVGNYKLRAISLFRKIGTAGNPVHAVAKLKSIISQDGWKGIQLRIAYALHGPSEKILVPVNGSIDDLVDGNDYGEWIHRYDTLAFETAKIIRNRIDSFVHQPVISVVMPVFDPPVELLKDAIESVCNQLYPHWELCIADDKSTNSEIHDLLQKYSQADDRIKVVFRQHNGHISMASNSALELVQGEFVALMDHDDLLPSHALFMVVDTINRLPDVQMIYSDEDKIDLQGRRHSPLFKCDWNPDLFLSHNFFSHFGIYRASLIRELGGFRPGFEGAQDYDLALRCTEHVRFDQIVHIPHVLYHWRAFEGSTALATDAKPYALTAGRKAISEYLQRNKKEAVCELKENSYRIRYAVPSSQPMVSLIVPTMNAGENLKICVESILAKTTYEYYEIIIVNCGGQSTNTVDWLQDLKNSDVIRVVHVDASENYDAHFYNTGVQAAQGEVVGFLHDDVEVISTDWLEELVSHACRKEIGAVGARLWYPNNTLQHGGIVLGIRGNVGHAHRGIVKGFPGYRRRAELIQNFSAVSAACLFVEKKLFDYIGGLDEVELDASMYDVDFCLKLLEQGYRNLWTPYAELYHQETSSLNNESRSVPQVMIIQDQLKTKERWRHYFDHDPAYS
ncbi:MAG: glycosyltransferase, partial [Thermodesulfobacteriota bacterium]|nr:glycosyltransferase [Thermodesulfobacteriota bacterium]